MAELRIVQGNLFGTAITITAVDATGHAVQDFSLEQSTDISVWYLYAGKRTDVEAWSIEDGKVVIVWAPDSQKLGTYDIFIEGVYGSTEWRNAMRSTFTIVRYNYEANIPEDVVVLNGIYQLTAEMALITQISGGSGTPSTDIPPMDGEGSAGTENTYARGDHQHPSDTSKQDVIADLGTIRAGAAAGATAYQKPSGGIPSTDMDAAVQASLARADSALQSYTETDPVFEASPAATITAQDISDWNGKSDFSGSYNDLTNKPTIPTVNDATLTVQKEGVSVGTFTANASSASTINIVETDPVFVASAAHGITSADITAWNAKQAALTFDEYPTDSSNNPVKSGGIYTINTTKQDKMFMETVSNGTTLRAGLNYLHKMVSAVNTLNIILPVPSSIIYLNNTKIEFTTGDSPSITFTSTATVNVSLTFEPNTHYLIECYYVPSEWIVDSVDAREKMANKVTSLSSSSTDTQYPSAKAVYDELADKADANAVVTSFNGSTGAVTYTAPVTSVNGSTGAVTVQETLVSGTNIKTINSTSLLGSGDITIQGGSSGIPIVNHGTSDTTYSVTPNTLHVWGEVATLTLTLATPSDATIVNEYMIQFESGSTPTTLSLPATVEWAESCGALSVEASKTYQVSIVNNIGLWAAISNS